MPVYIHTISRRTVDASVATANGRVLPGYAEIVGDGEHVRFDIAMRDSAGGSSMFMTDAPSPPVFAAERQQQIAEDAARTHAARTHLNNAYVADQVRRCASERQQGGRSHAAIFAEARYTGAPVPAARPAGSVKVDDKANAAAVAAIRAARYA